VSVVVPCYNEQRYIRATLESLLSGTFNPAEMEVLVVDGISKDGTRAIIEEIARRDPRVRLLDNPCGLTPVALNIGIRAARGEIIMRIDSHSIYPPRYAEVLVRTLESTGADMVGGCVTFVPAEEGLVCRAIAVGTGCAFGTGARFRYRRKDGPVDAVQLGCWRREIFERVGLFDERMVRNQDNEHSSRILHAGGRLHMTAEVTIQYHPRSSLKKLWQQAWVTGMWNAFTQRLHPYTFRWRHFLPAIFFLGVLACSALIVAGLFTDYRLALVGAACLLPYALMNLFFSCLVGLRHPGLFLTPLIAFVLFTYHFTYGYGITKGWLLVATGAWRKHLGVAPKHARVL